MEEKKEDFKMEEFWKKLSDDVVKYVIYPKFISKEGVYIHTEPDIRYAPYKELRRNTNLFSCIDFKLKDHKRYVYSVCKQEDLRYGLISFNIYGGHAGAASPATDAAEGRSDKHNMVHLYGISKMYDGDRYHLITTPRNMIEMKLEPREQELLTGILILIAKIKQYTDMTPDKIFVYDHAYNPPRIGQNYKAYAEFLESQQKPRKKKGGSKEPQKVSYNGRVYKVRIQDGKKYILSKNQPITLGSIRGKYRYV